MKPRVAIIYLCWGMRDYVEPVVQAVSAQTYPKESMKLFMVTAGSKDGIQDVIRQEVLPRSRQDLPETVLLDDPVNRGFAGNNNVAVREAMDEGFDYIFLHNGDLKLHQNAIAELVDLAESDNTIGSVQSLVLYWNNHEQVNTSGGVFHAVGYGYARDNLKSITDIHYKNGSEISYASGAAVLYRTSALRDVGLMEEGFFMYHEDLELGIRLFLAGFKNVLGMNSWAFHDYKFSRNEKMFAWTELYRWIVVLSFYKIPTLILLLPLLMCVELGTWIMAARGGWLKAKLYPYKEVWKKKTWQLLWTIRSRAQRLRVKTDRELLAFVTGKIEAQEQHNAVVEYVANPVISLWLRVIRFIVRW